MTEQYVEREFIALMPPGWSDVTLARELWEAEAEMIERHSLTAQGILWEDSEDENVLHLAVRPPMKWVVSVNRLVPTYEEVPIRWIGRVTWTDDGLFLATFGPEKGGEKECHASHSATGAWLWLIARIWRQLGYPVDTPTGMADVEEASWEEKAVHLKVGLRGQRPWVDGYMRRTEEGWCAELHIPGEDRWEVVTRTRLAALMLFADRVMDAAADGELDVTREEVTHGTSA